VEFLGCQLQNTGKRLTITMNQCKVSIEDSLDDMCLGYDELAPEHHLNWIGDSIIGRVEICLCRIKG
jgi:hypothetical protein